MRGGKIVFERHSEASVAPGCVMMDLGRNMVHGPNVAVRTGVVRDLGAREWKEPGGGG